jgi:FMN reductase
LLAERIPSAAMSAPSASQRLLVVGIVGSVSLESRTRRVVRLALDGAEQMGARVALIDLRDYDLPFAGDEEAEETADVQSLRQSVRLASGVVLGTPEYHGGYSGVLKNALDLMGFDEFEGKMIGLVGVSGGALGATNALNDLRAVGRALHAWVVPEQAGVPHAHRAFDEDGRIMDQRVAERVREVGRQVARFASLHSAARWDEFLREWESAPKNPGGAGR